MKTNVRWSYQMHDAVTWAIACIMWLAVLLGMLLSSSCTAHTVRSDDMSYMQDTVRWAQFNDCSKDEGDAGCDSCFTMIYGYSLEEE